MILDYIDKEDTLTIAFSLELDTEKEVKEVSNGIYLCIDEDKIAGFIIHNASKLLRLDTLQLMGLKIDTKTDFDKLFFFKYLSCVFYIP